MDDEIRYINVEQGAEGMGKMAIYGQNVLPITIWEFDNNDFDTNNRAVAQEIFTLLTVT